MMNGDGDLDVFAGLLEKATRVWLKQWYRKVCGEAMMRISG